MARPAPLILKCQHCSEDMPAFRATKRFCSNACSKRSPYVTGLDRTCRHCGTAFRVAKRGEQNRQHCSKQCAKNHNAKRIKGWQKENPEAVKGYQRARVERNPGLHVTHAAIQRGKILALLGGRCVVCGVSNPFWLHVDYKRGSRGLKHRHPRHFAYIAAHPDEFQILCANHHYELTLTGRIEGTDIVQ